MLTLPNRIKPRIAFVSVWGKGLVLFEKDMVSSLRKVGCENHDLPTMQLRGKSASTGGHETYTSQLQDSERPKDSSSSG